MSMAEEALAEKFENLEQQIRIYEDMVRGILSKLTAMPNDIYTADQQAVSGFHWHSTARDSTEGERIRDELNRLSRDNIRLHNAIAEISECILKLNATVSGLDLLNEFRTRLALVRERDL